MRVKIESIYVITWLSFEHYRGMLGACLRRRALKAAHHSNLSNRRYFVQGLCDGFMDLALALPIPPSLPPYSSTIILLTIVTRFALLPISIWVRFSNSKSLFFILMLFAATRERNGQEGRRRLYYRKSRNSNLLCQSVFLKR